MGYDDLLRHLGDVGIERADQHDGEEQTDDLALRWDGPATAAKLLDTIERVLRSDESVSTIEGLL